ncbi:hypothetical protein FLONG3_9297 [Fusarium longipes]|uniref:Uncharacterized protein n=1 Tax=Fusarium longipes TaxID=694270 RepID=A0A395RZ39_9HYPO|nr:hypothetical protein FLONG3_9297 [Fusarium longipes]
MTWKRFAVEQAKAVSYSLDSQNIDFWHVFASIAQSESLLFRIAGNMVHATSSLELIQCSAPMDKRMNSTSGYIAIQRSLNCIQVEDLSNAENSLKAWTPLAYEHTSLLERVVMSRKHMMLGRILRLEGAFEQSRLELKRAEEIMNEHNELNFEEDLRDFTCDYADTLRELDDLEAAEFLLRAEIMRRDRNSISDKSLLELALAEVLFAQGRFEDAEHLCSIIESRGDLLKFGRLRLLVTMAKLQHLQSAKEDALSRWTGAMGEIGQFPLTNGYTTRIIMLSIAELVGGGIEDEVEKAVRMTSLEKVDTLGKNARPGGTKNWIAGLCQWAESRGFADVLNEP